MASNELAAILARRRAKAGGESELPVPAVEHSAPPAPPNVPGAAKSSIAERIAQLKQQSAAANAGETITVAPAAPLVNYSTSEPSESLQGSSSSVGSASIASAVSEPVDVSAVAAAQDAAGIRRASSKIQQLQGSLGINVNPFGRPGGPSTGGYRKPASVQRESIMSTGEQQYGHTQHSMGVVMPGMTGSVIPMPGLAKGGFKLPGMAAEGEQSAATSLDDHHATINRAAGPKRRGPTRPPPGAFRIPTMAAPIIDSVEPAPTETQATEVLSTPVPVVQSPTPDPAYAPAPAQTTVAPMAVLTPPTPAIVPTPQKESTPELFPSMKPYQIEDEDPYAPKYDAPVENSFAAAGLPSALLANFSLEELTLDDKPKSAPSTSASSLFGAPALNSEKSSLLPQSESPKPSPTPVFAAVSSPVPERMPSPKLQTESASVEVASPISVPTDAPISSPSTISAVSTSVTASQPTVATPAPFTEPTPATTSTSTPVPAHGMAPGSFLFGSSAASALDDDDSDESDWSDDENNGGSQSLFGGSHAVQSSASKPSPTAPASVLMTSSQTTSEVHQTSASSLFGSTSNSVPTAATPPSGFVQATPQPAIPPSPYSSLFSGAVSSSESESESDDEGGLFGTLPTTR